MKKQFLTALLLISTSQAQAFSQETHKRIVIDAVNYMQQHPSSTQFSALSKYAQQNNMTVTQLAEVLGQAAYDVDDFEDTFFCGAVTGSCVQAPIWGAAESIVKYTSYWHFQNHTQGADQHGNDFGGYNYQKLTVWGTVDNLASSWLKGDYLDDGQGGETGWFNADSSKYNSYGITEANYRIDSQSNYNMYDDFEEMPFQPIDNLGQYWYQSYLQSGNPQVLGFVFHTTDLLQPHHTWTTSDLNHSSWESWVKDYYDQEQLNDSALITQAMQTFSALDINSQDVRPLLTQGGAFSYAQGGIVLNSQDHYDRLNTAKQVIPHAIAMVVHLLNHAMVVRQ
ncbi:phospholipase [Pseudoalteromonas sp. SR44-5]|uniref:phospholipase n=1 Tax=Pseudoalteromonas TaxID=53246 RepID=UPI001602966D|nr:MULTISPECIES: phospholipase [unclassified Pseudoalteromonas]MBB1367447.1 phospholipase [Pseudoalteromonas sp. SR44-5]MBB1418284.1 phospholipase [Pseudoalteromonas sp. SG44-1]MBB1422696.1 phospholipase [Pseudoalteromonas sp. SG43-7]MBB1434488.1 phospholipase [Pseudoalteromonas sp. SG43-6]